LLPICYPFRKPSAYADPAVRDAWAVHHSDLSAPLGAFDQPPRRPGWTAVASESVRGDRDLVHRASAVGGRPLDRSKATKRSKPPLWTLPSRSCASATCATRSRRGSPPPGTTARRSRSRRRKGPLVRVIRRLSRPRVPSSQRRSGISLRLPPARSVIRPSRAASYTDQSGGGVFRVASPPIAVSIEPVSVRGVGVQQRLSLSAVRAVELSRRRHGDGQAERYWRARVARYSTSRQRRVPTRQRRARRALSNDGSCDFDGHSCGKYSAPAFR